MVLWLYVVLAPLLFAIIASRLSGVRRLVLVLVITIAGYAFIMGRQVTQHFGERAKKRKFLAQVAPRDRSQSNRDRSQSNGGRSQSNGYDSPRRSDSNGSAGGYDSPRRQNTGGKGMPPMIRTPSSALKFNQSPSNNVLKQSRQLSEGSSKGFRLGSS